MPEFTETAESSPSRLELVGFVEAAPQRLYRAFTDADLIVEWWSEEAAADPVVGGTLEVRWPSMNWTMRGVYTELHPGRAVSFTWSWDHEPDVPERSVQVRLAPEDAGTRVTLTHGAYGPDDAEERQGHLEGWQHFLPRLAATLAS